MSRGEIMQHEDDFIIVRERIIIYSNNQYETNQSCQLLKRSIATYGCEQYEALREQWALTKMRNN